MSDSGTTPKMVGNDLGEIEFDLEMIADEMAAIPSHKRKLPSQLTVFDVDRSDRAIVANAARDKDTTERLGKTMLYLAELGFTRPYAQPVDNWANRLQALKEDFPNFMEVISAIIEPHTILAALGHQYRMPPCLLVGPAGVGKTLFTRSLQQLWQVPLRFVDMASQTNSSALAGSSTFWANASPGQLFETLAWGHAGQAPVANPILILDEVDKVQSDRFDPLAALYSLLEEDTAKTFQDQALPNVSMNASHVRFILTANEACRIPGPILSRLAVFNIEPPSFSQQRQILQRIFEGILMRLKGIDFCREIPLEVVLMAQTLGPRECKLHLEVAVAHALASGRNALDLTGWLVYGASTRRGRVKLGFV